MGFTLLLCFGIQHARLVMAISCDERGAGRLFRVLHFFRASLLGFVVKHRGETIFLGRFPPPVSIGAAAVADGRRAARPGQRINPPRVKGALQLLMNR